MRTPRLLRSSSEVVAVLIEKTDTGLTDDDWHVLPVENRKNPWFYDL
jgi:hypothetical protein